MKRFFVPEVVQTSTMDCGPAALKCLFEGFGISVSYGRLREACQTGIDGTSIDTMENVANLLGLQAEQILIPADHLFVPEAKALPALVVVRLPNGLTHFVVVWSRLGGFVQVMDPSLGRRWVKCQDFANEIFQHVMPAAAIDWREFAGSPDFQIPLKARICALGGRRAADSLVESALEDLSWRSVAALDAATRLAVTLRSSGGLRGSRDCLNFIERLSSMPDMIPDRYWSVCAPEEDGQLLMRGAVLVRIKGKKSSQAAANLGPELRAAIQEKPVHPGRELAKALWHSGPASILILLLSLLIAAGGTLWEALLFRGLFDVTSELGLAGQRIGAIAAVTLFSFALLLLEIPVFNTAGRLGRQIENRLRMALLEKIPKLGDRYFQSRLTSDMAERSHATKRLRHLPDQVRQLLRSVFELLVTAGAMIWLEPHAAMFIVAVVLAALLPAFSVQSLLVEREGRARSHAAGLMRFYLDAMLGLLAVRAHGSERNVRRQHEKLLGDWASAALRLQRMVVSVEAVQLVAMFGLVAALFLVHPLRGAGIGSLLLLVYWALNLPVLGQEIGSLLRQYPYYRNLTLRLLDPLGALEEKVPTEDHGALEQAPAIELRDVSVEVSGHAILSEINFLTKPGTHVAIVGPSGAGKSSLIGLLLGWHKASTGEVLVDGKAVQVDQIRASAAWVDPAVQLWNRSLFQNVSYGKTASSDDIGEAIDTALLRGILENLPEGLQTKLGEGGALVSGGEGQRVRLARALLQPNARLAILDEPFRGLDRTTRRELLTRARRLWRDSTLLCITHDLEETRAFDRVLVIENGRVAECGNPQELLDDPESRYSQLLRSEERTRNELWGGDLWRHVRVHSGRIVEEVPRQVAENLPQAEVA